MNVALGNVLAAILAIACFTNSPAPADEPVSPAATSETHDEPASLVTKGKEGPRASITSPHAMNDATEFQDSAFESYLDIAFVGEAITSRNAILLTDVALQLAEGERVLLRQHKSGVTARALFEKAATIAAAEQDRATLERLKRAATVLKDEHLASQLAVLEKMGGVSRTSDPGLTVAVDAVGIDTFLRMKVLLDAIREAELLGDRNQLDTIEVQLTEAKDIGEPQKQALGKLINDACDSIRSEGSEETDAIAKLVGASRQHWVTRPQDWGKTGIQIFPNRDESVSNVYVAVPPHIDRDGRIWSGSGSGGGSGSVVGRANLKLESDGSAYWYSNYANGYGRVQSPVRAFLKYDRPNPANRLGQVKAGRPTSGQPSQEIVNWLRSLSPAEREAFLKNGYVRPSFARP